ncbi:MAG TPA: hypothetical protein VK327_15940, partial [Candidatus Paceibacterota bacterium]|nr:hypothetical protein [Candidatus Paceibacterota bacterium]
MKLKSWTTSAGLLAAALFAVGSATAAPPALNGALQLRPLTPQDLKDYSLAGKQLASGINTIGIGEPAYLDAVANIAIAQSNILSVTWTLTNAPFGSLATINTNSPLGANVPVYK